jgi:flagella synthesis protein FlgN
MINKTHPIAEKLLKNGLTLSLKLLDLLGKEADNLKNHSDASSLSNIAASKKEAVTKLELFSKQMSQVLATEKLQLTPQGISEYFKKAESVQLNTSQSNNYWNKIVNISKQCKLLNEKNGASINLLAQHTQRTLQIIKGKSRQATTYGPDGSTYNEQFSHAIVSV